jgi:glycosyltransferase involved in cell wall biosynthesis
MRILYIWDSDYPWDVRVEKICSSLAKHGHVVHIAARNLKKQPIYENINGIHIHRLRPFNNNRINYFVSFPAFFSPVWNYFLQTLIKEKNISLIIVRDLPMALAAMHVGKCKNIPVIFDMAEDYVAMIKDIWKVRKFKGLNLLVRNPHFAEMVERKVLKYADHILVVVEEAEKEILKKRIAEQHKISLVRNTPRLSSFDRHGSSSDVERITNRYSAIYVGGIQMGRGIQTVLDAISIIIKRIPNFLFVIVGDGYAKERLIAKTKAMAIENYVFWAGWVDHDGIYDYIRNSKVGIVPHCVTDHTNTTMPNKIYDFMGIGIPVVASDTIPMKRLLMCEQCGVTFKGEDPEDLARAIIEIHGFEEILGNSGKRAVKVSHNWGVDENRLMDAVQKTTTGYITGAE